MELFLSHLLASIPKPHQLQFLFLPPSLSLSLFLFLFHFKIYSLSLFLSLLTRRLFNCVTTGFMEDGHERMPFSISVRRQTASETIITLPLCKWPNGMFLSCRNLSAFSEEAREEGGICVRERERERERERLERKERERDVCVCMYVCPLCPLLPLLFPLIIN